MSVAQTAQNILSSDAIVVLMNSDSRGIAINRRNRKILHLGHAALAYLFLLATPGNEREALVVGSRLPKFIAIATEAGILSNSDTFEVGRVTRLKTSVERLFVEVTSACNLRCLHCYGSFAPERFVHLQFPMFSNLVLEAQQLGIYQFDLTGGEPMMHPNFPQMISLLDKSYMIYNVFSNLTHLTNAAFAAICDYPPMSVITSLESHDSTIHDRFRGRKGSHAKTLSNIVKLQDEKIPIKVNLVVGKHNYTTVQETIEWLKSLGVGVVVDTIHLEGRATEDLMISNAETYRLREMLETEYGASSRKDNCGVAAEMVYIDSKGIIRLCPSIDKDEYTLGNISNSRELETIIGNLPERFPLFHGLRCRKDCPVADWCLDPCQARSLKFGGRPDSPDPEMCARYLPSSVEEDALNGR